MTVRELRVGDGARMEASEERSVTDRISSLGQLRDRLFSMLVGVVAFASCTAADTEPREGYVDVPGGRVWYQTLGSGSQDGVPLLVIHGGPGFGSCSYVSTLTGIAEDRPVIIYDQLGAGRSDRPADTALWRIPRFLEEITAIRLALGLDEVHILGHSWGGTLAIEYLLTRPEGVRSVVFVGPLLGTQRWVEDARLLRAQLPTSLQEALQAGEESGQFTSAEYLAATDSFYARFFIRSGWPPPELPGCEEDTGPNMEVYEYMWGPTEFTATGTLSDFDRIDRLAELDLPTLFVVGEYDEIPVETVLEFRDLVPGSIVEIIDDAGHMVHIDGTAQLNGAVSEFLAGIDPR